MTDDEERRAMHECHQTGVTMTNDGLDHMREALFALPSYPDLSG